MNNIELIVRLIIKRGENILLCKSLKYGHYYLPGGHVEFGDSLERTIYKEIEEELGIKEDEISNISFKNYLENSYGEEGEMHCELNMIFSADIKDGVEVSSKEDHIAFEWVNQGNLGSINLLPKGIDNFLI